VNRHLWRIDIPKFKGPVHHGPVDQLQRSRLGLEPKKTVARLVVGVGAKRRWRLDQQVLLNQRLAHAVGSVDQKHKFGRRIDRVGQRGIDLHSVAVGRLRRIQCGQRAVWGQHGHAGINGQGGGHLHSCWGKVAA